MVKMGVPVERVQRLVNTVPKKGNVLLDFFGGPIHEDKNGNIVRLGNTDVGADGWMGETRFQKATNLPKEIVAAIKLAVMSIGVLKPFGHITW